MKILILFSVICLQLDWIYGAPEGVGAYAYQDTSGNRYGGTYKFNDDQLFVPPAHVFGVPLVQNYYQDIDDFFPEYFRNFERELHEAFRSNLAHQRLALDAARKAYDLTSNQAGYFPDFPYRSPLSDFQGFEELYPFSMPNTRNSAFAGAAAFPGVSRQFAGINPTNPDMPNVDVVNRFSDIQPGNNFVSMSSKSYSVSSNVDGKEFNDRGAETTVNNNGKVTTYSVRS